ncbi:MAG: hypothetical protein JO161_05905, partial [Planctomycetaceae bacterium]|nr:hypothetical protein [Planctomycetaceae bacterium]
MADRLLGPNPDLMPAMDSPVIRASKVDQTTPKPHAEDAAPKSADPAATEMPLETCPELPVSPQPATGTDTKQETGPVGSPSASADPSADSRTTETAAQMTVPRSSPEV